MIALVRTRYDQRTQDYVARRTAYGPLIMHDPKPGRCSRATNDDNY